jgi:hypothetical protein
MPLSPRTLRPSSSFNPRSISGLAIWLDASDASSLYTTDAGAVTAASSPTEISGCVLWLDGADNATITASGGLVSQWTDKSATGAVLTASGSARPTLSSTGFNSRQALVFNGTSTNMASSSAFTATNGLSGMTRIAVCAHTTNTVGALARVYDGGSDSFLFMNGSARAYVSNGGNFVSYNPNGSTSILSAGLYADTYSASALSFYSSGAGVSGTVTGTIPATTGSGSPTLHVGSNIGANSFWNGPVAEIVYFNRALTRAELARVEAYLAAKWGISGVHAPATATNDPVGAWLDKSGNGRNATQATGALRPTLGTLGAKNALAFAGNAIATQSYAAKATSTYVYVGRHDETADTFFQTGPTNGFHSHLVEATSKFRRNEAGTKGVILASNVGVGAVSLWCVDFSNDAISVRHNGVTYGTTSVASEAAISDSSRATTLGRLAAAETYAQLNGRIAEFMVYGGRNLTSDERSRLERHLASKYAITLAPAASNADAQDWINRVYQNGGTVSASTASAVNQFCNAIDSAGIRDRFYRMGIFAGTGLNACLVPLYRGPSLGGTQYGNTTDTNVGPFVSGDYAETGASGGLANANRSKYLNTGFPTNTVPAGDRHQAFYARTFVNADYDIFMGSESAASISQQFAIGHQVSASDVRFSFGGSTSAISSAGSVSTGAFWLGVHGTSTGGVIYKNGASDGTGTLTAATPTTSEMHIFGINRASIPANVDRYGGTSGGYSIGLSMTAAQAAAYSTAMQAFQTAMGRNV